LSYPRNSLRINASYQKLSNFVSVSISLA